MSMINNFLLLFIFREPFEPGLKLAIKLRHMATGATFRELVYSFRVAEKNNHKIHTNSPGGYSRHIPSQSYATPY